MLSRHPNISTRQYLVRLARSSLPFARRLLNCCSEHGLTQDVIVEVVDPNSFIVERWTITLDANGVGEFQMPISEEPLLGDYVLKV
eukprot:1186533-Prorocentrum_minimum.AAC.2